MRTLDAHALARMAGAELLRDSGEGGGPSGVGIDTRTLERGDLFVGLPGSREDGGARGGEALGRGAWGVLVRSEHARTLLAEVETGTVLAHEDPLSALQSLARGWRMELGSKGASVIGVTGSTGKTSTKDILRALLGAHVPTVASPANLNTEIGLPLAILAAPETTRALVLEMAMRGPGQIAELTRIADPDVGVIVNVGPAHLELLGSLENIAAAKAELIAGMRPGCALVVPAEEPLLSVHLREDLRTVTFGEGGDVSLLALSDDGVVSICHEGREIELRPSFREAHNLHNLLAATAVARVLGITPSGDLEVEFSAMRGQRSELPGDMLLIDDCYNANPMSMHAAIEELAATSARRRVAVLGDMLELGPEAPAMHQAVGAHAKECGVEMLVAVGPLAGEMVGPFGGNARALANATSAVEEVPAMLEQGDVILVKGSRGVGLERLAEALRSTGAGEQRSRSAPDAVEAGR